MIFVILGTQDKNFDRLLKEIDNQIIAGNIKDKVIVQAGYTKYKSDNMEVFDLISIKKFNDLIDKANFIITHGGVGSILSSLKKGKKIIVVPRLSKYKEHTNDHQLQITKKLSDEGYILSCNNIKNLKSKIKEINKFVPKKYIGGNEIMIDTIKNFIEK